MALSKVNFNSLNVTPAASKAIKFNSNNNGIETGDVGGSMVLLETQTASSSGTLSFTSNINSTYKEYIFKFIDIHPQTDDKDFQFNLSVDSGSNYNVTKTDTAFRAYHTEDGSGSGVGYQSSMDLAQSTNFANMCSGLGNGNDECLAGILHLFNPSSTTFVKHYITHTISYHGGDLALDHYTAGYGNTTSAVDAIQFKMSSGNIDAGSIVLYGIN
jgi:hypothetical protein